MNYVSTNLQFPGMIITGAKKAVEQSYLKQSTERIEIDEAICNNLDGDVLKEALFIVDNIRENNMKIKWSSPNSWSVSYKFRHVCELRVEHGALSIGKISDVLITRVRNMQGSTLSMNPLYEMINDMINSGQEPAAAAQH